MSSITRSEKRSQNKARHTLIHSRPSQRRLPPLAHDSSGAVAQFYFGADSTDAQQRFTYINAADERLRGFTRQEVIGTFFRDNLTPEGVEILLKSSEKRCEIESSAHKGLPLNYELPMRHHNGNEVWMEMSSVPIYDLQGDIKGYQGVGRDVSHRRLHVETLLRSQEQLATQLQAVEKEKTALEELATLDPLTGLYNRRFLEAALPREFARADREQKQLAIIMLDLDHFKAVNDTHSHAAGDVVLQTLAELLKKGAREGDLICRYGGEEFVVIMPHISPKQALERVDSWRQQLERTTVVYGKVPIRVTLSGGGAIYPDHGRTADQLLTRADKMLYKSKQAGRNQISL